MIILFYYLDVIYYSNTIYDPQEIIICAYKVNNLSLSNQKSALFLFICETTILYFKKFSLMFFTNRMALTIKICQLGVILLKLV